jgi:RNA polymerase sigma factor (sigma-70 family)
MEPSEPWTGIEADEPPVSRPPVAFEAFFDEQYPRLLRALFLVTGNEQEADELMQDAFIAVWERWDRVGTMDNPSGYLYRTAINKHRSSGRRAARAARRLVGLDAGADHFAASDERDALARVMAQLPARQRETIVLVELLGYSPEEAGPILGIAPATVRVHTSKARSAMRPLLEESDD